jgi:hypothetical protein
MGIGRDQGKSQGGSEKARPIDGLGDAVEDEGQGLP